MDVLLCVLATVGALALLTAGSLVVSNTVARVKEKRRPSGSARSFTRETWTQAPAWLHRLLLGAGYARMELSPEGEREHGARHEQAGQPEPVKLFV